MIDVITINYLLTTHFAVWRLTLLAIGIEFDCKVGVDSGEQITKKRSDCKVTKYYGKWQTYQLKVTVCEYATHTKEYLTIKGSLHKNFYNGTNYQPFNWVNLQSEINTLCNALQINSNKSKISSLEVGVNIVPPFIVDSFLHNNIINYKGKKFNSYEPDATNFILGIKCVCTQYQVKIYNKGTQYKLPYPLLRIEKRYTKMKPLKRYGIFYLSDVQKFEKVAPMVQELTTMWNDVLIYDVKPNPSELNLTAKEKVLMLNWCNPNYWDKQKNRTKKSRDKKNFKKLMLIYGNNWHKMTLDLIVNEWEQLLKSATFSPSG
jgi:hypothetical protein